MRFVHSSSFLRSVLLLSLAWDLFQHVAYHLLWVSKTFLGFSLRFTSWTTEFLFKIHSSYLKKRREWGGEQGQGRVGQQDNPSFVFSVHRCVVAFSFLYFSRTSLCWFSGLATYCLCFCNSVGIMRVFIYHASYPNPPTSSSTAPLQLPLTCTAAQWKKLFNDNPRRSFAHSVTD